MAINISDEDETRSYKLFSRLVEKLEDNEIGNLAAVATCVHILKLAANDNDIELRRLLDKDAALDLVIFRITQMPTPRKT